MYIVMQKKSQRSSDLLGKNTRADSHDRQSNDVLHTNGIHWRDITVLCVRGKKSVFMEQKMLLMIGSMLPAGILIFLTVHKWAGLQLAAHYRGAVVTHGWVPRSALWFRVTVDARDWREKERKSSSESDREVTLLAVRSHQNKREHPGGEVSQR